MRLTFGYNATSQFGKFTGGDVILVADDVKFDIGPDYLDDSLPDALDHAFAYANRYGKPGPRNEPYPSWVRSLSVGDVIVVRTDEGDCDPIFYAVESVGFRQIEDSELARLLLFSKTGTRSALATYGIAAPEEES